MHIGRDVTCPGCLADIAQNQPCTSCSAYPGGPDDRCRTLDRIEVACGHGHPARPDL